MRPQERSEVAAALKTKGNGAYSKKQYAKAVEYYTNLAIQASPKPEPTYFSNRAACTSSAPSFYEKTSDVLFVTGYMSMQVPQYEKVVADCDAALVLDKKYIKALDRRAAALEALERYEESSRGMYIMLAFLHRSCLILCRLYGRHHFGEVFE